MAAPRAIPRIDWLRRFRGRGWALVADRVDRRRDLRDPLRVGHRHLAHIPGADRGAAAGGAWRWAGRCAARRRSPRWRAVPLFAIAWVAQDSLAGEAAGSMLSALSCVTLGVLLAAVTPPGWLKVGILLMAVRRRVARRLRPAADPERDARRGPPAGGLPQLQSEIFGSVIDGLRGPVRGRRCSGRCWPPAARCSCRGGAADARLAAVFDLLFFVVSELPATVPVALALITLEVWERGSAAQCFRRRSTPAAATPRRAT